jgi:hypothetical protein
MTGQVTKFGDGGDGDRQRHATEGLERFDDGAEPAQAWPGAWSAYARRWSRSVGSVTAQTYSWKTMGGAGVGHTTALSQRRCAAPPVTRPV